MYLVVEILDLADDEAARKYIKGMQNDDSDEMLGEGYQPGDMFLHSMADHMATGVRVVGELHPAALATDVTEI